MKAVAQQGDGVDLLPEVTCPNCWKKFPPEAAMAIAGSPALVGDPRLEDPRAFRRFRSTRFTPECAAVDEKETACYEAACPFCHLLIPRVLFERRETLFLSIFGKTTSGKSYYLTSMAKEMETSVPRRFGVSWTEPHPASNEFLRKYKRDLFDTVDPDALVDLPATPPTGPVHYQRVRQGEAVTAYPRPLVFQVAPTGHHPKADSPTRLVRNICLYDNAGEHFRAGHASPQNPETQHLSRASALFFVFDPTRDPGFISFSRQAASDPQYAIAVRGGEYESQDAVLATADENVKRFLGKEIADPLEKPLVVILAKFDAWKHLVAEDLPDPSRATDGSRNSLEGLDIPAIEGVSQSMRQLLLKLSPSIVTTAERMSRRVSYIPVSATGCEPVVAGSVLTDTGTLERLKFVRGSIRPVWVEVPMLWVLRQLTSGLIPTLGKRSPTPPR